MRQSPLTALASFITFLTPFACFFFLGFDANITREMFEVIGISCGVGILTGIIVAWIEHGSWIFNYKNW